MSAGAEAARVLGRYAVLDEIAAGGMATVHLGRVLQGEAEVGHAFVAIKRMHPQYAKDPDFRSMFLDEAKLCLRIEHANVVRTLDVVDGQELLLVMELIEGESLSRLAKQAIQAGKRMPVPIIATVVRDMLWGLHAAHEATSENGEALSIVHRDVSPHNVLVGTDGVSRVLDFGVAKARGRMQQTQQGQIKGKLAYMSPEQARGKQVDRRSDVFAAGVVLWELLVGARLFDGENEASVLTQLLTEKPALVGDKHADLRPFDGLVMKALVTNVAERYASALEMAEAITRGMPLATREEVAQWVAVEARVAIERRSAMRAMRAREKIRAGDPSTLSMHSTGIRDASSSRRSAKRALDEPSTLESSSSGVSVKSAASSSDVAPPPGFGQTTGPELPTSALPTHAELAIASVPPPPSPAAAFPAAPSAAAPAPASPGSAPIKRMQGLAAETTPVVGIVAPAPFGPPPPSGTYAAIAPPPPSFPAHPSQRASALHMNPHAVPPAPISGHGHGFAGAPHGRASYAGVQPHVVAPPAASFGHGHPQAQPFGRPSDAPQSQVTSVTLTTTDHALPPERVKKLFWVAIATAALVTLTLSAILIIAMKKPWADKPAASTTSSAPLVIEPPPRTSPSPPTASAPLVAKPAETTSDTDPTSSAEPTAQPSAEPSSAPASTPSGTRPRPANSGKPSSGEGKWGF